MCTFISADVIRCWSKIQPLLNSATVTRDKHFFQSEVMSLKSYNVVQTEAETSNCTQGGLHHLQSSLAQFRQWVLKMSSSVGRDHPIIFRPCVLHSEELFCLRLYCWLTCALIPWYGTTKGSAGRFRAGVPRQFCGFIYHFSQQVIVINFLLFSK